MLSVLVLAFISTGSPAPCCRVEGIVRSEAGAIVADASVSLTAPDLKAPLTTTSSAEGHYGFDGVKPGTWAEVRVLVNGRPVAESVTLVTQPVETLNLTISAAPTSASSVEDLKPMGGESGELRGIVRRTDGTPLAGARVGIDGIAIETTTDSSGRYSFGRVRAPMNLGITATANGFATATKQIAVPEKGSADANFSLSPDTARDDERPLALIETPRDRETVTLRAPELSAVPGLAPFDVFRAIDLLPASAVGDDTAFVLNGTAAGDTPVTLDGIPWFPSRRLAGQIGAPLNTAFIQQLELADAPLASPAGGALAGALAFSGRPTRQDRPGGSGEVDFFGVSGSASVPIAHAGAVSVAARHSLTSQLYDDVLDAFAGPDQHYVRDRVPSLPGAAPLQTTPLFSDVNGRVDLTPGRGNRLTASVYHGRDDGNFSRDIAAGPGTAIAAPPVLTLPADATVQMGDAQTWTGRGAGVDWSRQWTDTISTDASLVQSRFTTARQRSFLLTSPATGVNYNVAAGLGGSSGTDEANDIRDTDVRASVSIDAGFAHAVQAGVERTALDATYAARTEALVHTSSAAASTSELAPLLDRQTSGHVSIVFGQDVWTVRPNVTVSPGARVSRDDLAGMTYVDPRVAASYAAAPGFVLKGTWAIDHQAAPRITREDLSHGDMDFWTLADGVSVRVPRSDEISTEGSYERAGVFVDARIVYRWLDDLTLFAPRLLPGAVPSPPASALYTGTGRSAGFEWLVQHRIARNSLWASYTASRVEYAFPTLQATSFLAPFDRRQQAKVVDAFTIGKGFSATGVMTAGTGAPYTPASATEPVWFASGEVAYQPQFGPKDSARLPAYHRLDVSGQFERRIGAASAAAGVTVFNVYDAKNIAYYDYEAAGTSLITTETFLMRRAVNAFVRVRF